MALKDFSRPLSLAFIASLWGALPGMSVPALAAGIAPRAEPLKFTEPLRERNFPLFAFLESRAGRTLLRDEQTLDALASRQRARLVAALEDCGSIAGCYIEAARWSEADRSEAAGALRSRCRAAAAACAQLLRAVRESGTMIRFHGSDDADLLASAWMLQAGLADHILQVYGLGKRPRYPAIDSMGSDPASPQFASVIREVVEDLLAVDTDRRPFHADLQQMALALLRIDGRDEGGRYEPLDRGENRAAARATARRRDWSQYRYSAILVPGQGPEVPGIRLSPGARQRLEAGVQRYREGIAPLIIVSGGHVHPARTPWCEAIEMKRVLMTEFGVPERSILIDPHARHTTTNLRNAARLLFRYGAPMDQPMLIVTDAQQAAYIASEGFDARNRTETGVVPYVRRQLESPTTVSVVPSLDALQVGFEDPLDP